jgi:hypothetical protein
MIVKLSIPQIELLVDNLDVEITYQHQCNLRHCKLAADFADSDQYTLQLLGLYYQLKNILLVEQAKLDQVQQQIQYLRHRRDMLLDYMVVIVDDSSLIDAIESIQLELVMLTKSAYHSTTVEVHIADELHQLLQAKNLIN